MQHLSGEVFREILQTAPRQLAEIDAELLFIKEQYLFHYREGTKEHYKLLSSVSLRTAFSHEPIDTDWMPPGVIRWGTNSQGNWVVKFISPAQYNLQFDDSKPITIPLTALVFVGQNTQYWVFATDLATFNPESKAYHTPLPNIHPNGLICWGKNTPPVASTQTIDIAWQSFITTPFNADLSSQKSRKFPQDVREHLKSLALRKRRTYPVKDLVEVRYSPSIDSLVQHLLLIANPT